MDYQQSKYTIDNLIQRIRAGKLALPDFQRDFVWEPKEVVDLLDSVSRQWPIGSLLLLSGPQPFAYRAVFNGPALSKSGLDLYILDGQQRVTALFHAIADVSEYCYYVDFNALLRGEDEVFSWERRTKFEKQYISLANRANKLVALVNDLWEISQFYEWLQHVPKEFDTSKLIQLRQKRLGGLQSRVYSVFSIVLEQDIDLEALARIFETVNRKGVDLDAFELLVAKLYTENFNLKDEWEKARDEHSILKTFDPDEKHKIEQLKLISLLIRAHEGKKASRGVRQGDLLAINKSHISQYWKSGVDLMAETLNICREKFGVHTPDLLPNWAMVHGIAGLLTYNEKDRLYDWWTSSIVNQSFAQAANSKVVAHWDSLQQKTLKLEENSFTLEDVKELLNKPAAANGLLNKGLMGLIAARGARDLLTGELICKESEVTFRAIGSDRIIRKLKPSDTISSVVIISKASDKKMGRQYALENTPLQSKALKSQGFNGNDLKRTDKYLLELLNNEAF